MVVQGTFASAFSKGSPGSEVTLYKAEQRDEYQRPWVPAKQTNGGKDKSSSLLSSRNFASGAFEKESPTRMDKERAIDRTPSSSNVSQRTSFPALDAGAILQSSLRSACSRNELLCSDDVHILGSSLRPATPPGKVMDAGRDIGLEVGQQPTEVWQPWPKLVGSKSIGVSNLSECPDAIVPVADRKRSSGLDTLHQSCSRADQLQCRSVEGFMFYACMGRGK